MTKEQRTESMLNTLDYQLDDKDIDALTDILLATIPEKLNCATFAQLLAIAHILLPPGDNNSSK